MGFKDFFNKKNKEYDPKIVESADGILKIFESHGLRIPDEHKEELFHLIEEHLVQFESSYKKEIERQKKELEDLKIMIQEARQKYVK